jgi:hypothetical protein
MVGPALYMVHTTSTMRVPVVWFQSPVEANTPGEIDVTSSAGLVSVMTITTPEMMILDPTGRSTLVETLTVSMLFSAQA